MIMGECMKKSILLVPLFLLALLSAPCNARNWYEGFTVTKVYDQRPYKMQIDISISPSLHGTCDSISFIVGIGQVTESNFNSLQSTALAALMSGSKVGGLWAEPEENSCYGTNLHVSK